MGGDSLERLDGTALEPLKQLGETIRVVGTLGLKSGQWISVIVITVLFCNVDTA